KSGEEIFPSFCGRFNWTDGKLNSSNLIELSGQITEKFDEEFRILYAQSLPMNTRGPASAQTSESFERVPSKHLLTSSPYLSRERPPGQARVTSTPGRKVSPLSLPLPCEEIAPEEVVRNGSAASNSSTIGDDWLDPQHMEEEILAAGPSPPAEQPDASEPAPLSRAPCHAATQTSFSAADGDTRTDVRLTRHPDLSRSMAAFSQNKAASLGMSASAQAAPTGTVKECLSSLTKERQHHYTAIRSKLEHMMASLSQRRDLADIAVMTRGRRGLHKATPVPEPRLLAGNAAVVT
ncbi:protein FAM83D-like, partial [Hippocampus comes]|uniref:protein FAM83D-like n=1 Tax=Hippocampus comes TaxID=109280 RepID=UPI00094E38B2